MEVQTSLLPPLARLVSNNLAALGYGEIPFDWRNTADRLALISSASEWLYPVMLSLPLGEDVKVWMRARGLDHADGDRLYQSPAVLFGLEAGTYSQLTLAGSMARAMRDLAVEVNLDVHPAHERLQRLARWVAGAALTAHQRLAVEAARDMVIRLDTEPGEDPVSASADVARLLQAVPGADLSRMPLDKFTCRPAAERALRERFRRAAATVVDAGSTAGVRRLARPEMIRIAYHLAAVELQRQNNTGCEVSAKLVGTFLPGVVQRYGLPGRETEILFEIASESRSAGNETQTVHRGRLIWLVELAKSWQPYGLLTPNHLAESVPGDSMRRDIVKALVKHGLIAAGDLELFSRSRSLLESDFGAARRAK